MYDVKQGIEDLIFYAQEQLGLVELDAVYARNQLMSLFGTDDMGVPSSELKPIQEILDPMNEYAVEKGLTTEDAIVRFETKVMGYVTPSPSFVAEMFNLLYEDCSPEEATRYLNELSVANNYIRMKDVSKNLRWDAKHERGDVVVTINLSKPEKSAEQVARERLIPNQKYPKCMLCFENLGYNGSVKHPARQTLRIVPVDLAGEEWYMQMSPYVYYDNHVICFNKHHSPMAITDMTFKRLTDFVAIFPHYFLGSNADLPIVGGSILSHDHYQGGGKVLPMFSRPIRTSFGTKNGVKVSILDWYNSVVFLQSKDQVALLNVASEFLSKWREYSDESVGIIAKTDAPHNTITPIATMNENKEFELYLILRNNRTDEQHPEGIYHPSRDMHHIKKEGIGLIEAMGIFILPGRLQKEMQGVVDIIAGDKAYDEKELTNPENPLAKHKDMIDELRKVPYKNREEAENAKTEYINDTCRRILDTTAVFKNTDEGQKAFAKFIHSVID